MNELIYVLKAEYFDGRKITDTGFDETLLVELAKSMAQNCKIVTVEQFYTFMQNTPGKVIYDSSK
jgi:hypothetical protein